MSYNGADLIFPHLGIVIQNMHNHIPSMRLFAQLNQDQIHRLSMNQVLSDMVHCNILQNDH